MNSRHLVAASLATAALALPALAHASTNVLVEQADKKDWEQCMIVYRTELDDHELTESTKTKPLDRAIGSLPAGSTPTTKQVADECRAQSKARPDAERRKAWKDRLDHRVLWYRATKDDNTSSDLLRFGAECGRTLDAALEVMSPDDVIDSPPYKGPLSGLRPICDRLLDMGTKKLEAETAPYIKAGLKNDKLKRLLDDHFNNRYRRPGGDLIDAPDELMKANVWFLEFGGDPCGVDKVTDSITRYQFDKDQKLVKETHLTYCGDPPGKFYK